MPASVLHPDRNFATIACCSADDGLNALAQLERGTFCALLRADACSGALCVLEGQEAAGEGVRVWRTLDVGERGVQVEAFRSTLTAMAKGGASPLSVVDNSAVGPYLCRPLQMGAQVVVESLETMAFGMNALVPTVDLSAYSLVAARTVGAWERFCDFAGLDPARSSLHDAGALGVLGAALPLHSRAAQARSDNALVAANYLAVSPFVLHVSYPGLSDDPANDPARRTLEHGFGYDVVFELAEGLAPLDPVSSRPPRSALEPLGSGRYVLHAGLEEALDVVGMLEDLIASARLASNPVS